MIELKGDSLHEVLGFHTLLHKQIQYMLNEALDAGGKFGPAQDAAATSWL